MVSMEFWGVEVKAGESLKVIPEGEKLIHISQAALGEGKKDKGNIFVPLRVNVGGQKLILANLSAERFPQITFDLVFDKEFELSHDWKNGSVYFSGYKVDSSSTDSEGFSDSEFSSEEEDEVIKVIENVPKVEKVKPETSKASASKPESSSKPKVMLVEPSKGNENDDDDDEDEDEEDDDDEDEISDSDEDEEMLDDLDGSSDDEATPKAMVGSGKKRVIESATKTPTTKKAKLASPQKSGGKKGAHTATPYPSKQAGKAPAKSGGQVSCNTCSKTFNSDGALQSHTKAKHGGK
ncbi:histone deacetylase HDT1-like [Cornus florida]|uniref:histone deacetylase HDT1-like n=1 Tax=Cornus florida TaxID=4283 RepID=UPI0028A1E1DE|nr:histone deacetylase HDT1-like [Cornus florida]